MNLISNAKGGGVAIFPNVHRGDFPAQHAFGETPSPWFPAEGSPSPKARLQLRLQEKQDE